MRRSAKIACARPISAPNPDALSNFIDKGGYAGGYAGTAGGGVKGFSPMEPPPFRPTTTLAGGVGGGFGTGGGFGSTGGFHTMRLQPWQEPKRVDLTDTEPKPVPTPSQWAPTACARAVSHTVNKIRADLEPTYLNKAIVRDDECAAPLQASDPREPAMVMQSEKFELFTVKVPPTRMVQPPDALFRQDKLMTPKDRESILVFEKQKRMADLVLGRDRHKQMRLISLMQKRFPSGVLGVESAASDGTVVYAAKRFDESIKAQVAHEARLRKQDWIIRNSRSEPHLGYDFLQTIPKEFEPPPGAPEREMWKTKARADYYETEYVDTKSRIFQGSSIAPLQAIPDEGTHKYGRMTHLRSRDTENKNFNIITGAEYTWLPPSGPLYPSATPHQARTMHPSLNPGPAPSHITWGESK